MTAERRWSVRLTDIQAILLECKNCHTTSGYPPQKWGRVPYGCTNCSEPRGFENTLEYKTLDSFRRGLVEAIKNAEGLGFEIRFEFDGAPAQA